MGGLRHGTHASPPAPAAGRRRERKPAAGHDAAGDARRAAVVQNRNDRASAVDAAADRKRDACACSQSAQPARLQDRRRRHRGMPLHRRSGGRETGVPPRSGPGRDACGGRAGAVCRWPMQRRPTRLALPLPRRPLPAATSAKRRQKPSRRAAQRPRRGGGAPRTLEPRAGAGDHEARHPPRARSEEGRQNSLTTGALGQQGAPTGAALRFSFVC